MTAGLQEVSDALADAGASVMPVARSLADSITAVCDAAAAEVRSSAFVGRLMVAGPAGGTAELRLGPAPMDPTAPAAVLTAHHIRGDPEIGRSDSVSLSIATTAVSLEGGEAVDHLFVTHDGDVGVGVAAPEERLHVRGNIKVSGDVIGQSAFIDGVDVLDVVQSLQAKVCLGLENTIPPHVTQPDIPPHSATQQKVLNSTLRIPHHITPPPRHTIALSPETPIRHYETVLHTAQHSTQLLCLPVQVEFLEGRLDNIDNSLNLKQDVLATSCQDVCVDHGALMGLRILILLFFRWTRAIICADKLLTAAVDFGWFHLPLSSIAACGTCTCPPNVVCLQIRQKDGRRGDPGVGNVQLDLGE